MALLDEQALARTYSHPSVADPWEIVKQYRAAMTYSSEAGSTAVARDLDVPRGRVRPWLNGAKPDPVRAIEVADDNGWFANEWTPTTKALARLVAGVFACGGISSQNYNPSWSPSVDVTTEQLAVDLDAIGVGARRLERASFELRPTAHGSIVGRALAAAGAPVGDKTADTVRELPEWLDDAPPSVRADFAELLVRERATQYPGKATRRIVGNRHPSYFRQVAELLRDVTDERVTWSEAGVTISADAVRALGLA